MKIAIVATHSFPIPFKDLHTGDVCILNLAKTLQSFGHDVTMIAPSGTDFQKLIPMRASYGKYPPSSETCESEVLSSHLAELKTFDIVHDFSNTKVISQVLNGIGQRTCSTLLGGAWLSKRAPINLVVWSKSHRDRVLRGATDFEGTSTPDLAGPNGYPVKDVHVVNGGVDSGFYCPDRYQKDDYFLWLGRWHQARGYRFAIELAKRSGRRIVVAGDHPDVLLFDAEKACAKEAEQLCKGWPNITLEWLPRDPDHHTRKRELIRQAKALLYCVDFCEPFGLSQAEALCCGTPIIGSDFGSVPEVVTEGKTGFICKLETESFLSAMNHIDEIDPQFCRKNGAQRFSLQVMAKNYLAEYSKILGGGNW